MRDGRVILAGWCDGGPLDRQRLAHDAPRYRVAIRPPLGNPLTVDPPDARDIVIREGEYVWDDGAWRWKEPPR